MISVVGIGNFCSKIVDALKQYPQYNVYKIISTPEHSENTLNVGDLKNSEMYEQLQVDYPTFIKDTNSFVTVFIDGSEPISGVVLKFLESLKTRQIKIVYICSDLQLMSSLEKTQDKICFNVLQEYARSGLFKNITLIDKTKLENILGNVSILEYEEKIINLVVSTYHMTNVYANTKPVLTNSIENNTVCRISTYGLSDIGGDAIRWFFDINNIDNIVYYFAINSDTLKKEQKLLQSIKKQVKDKQVDNMKVMFGVYETTYMQNYVYCEANTKIIQTRSSA